jgi:hypothetical protein
MSSSSNILVNIIGEFKKKGFDDASKASKGLGKTFDNLGKKLAAAFSVAAVMKFAKVSLNAFKEDQAAAFKLTQTLKNLGMAFEDPQVQAFIKSLEQQTGVLDDQLRPAMGRLLQTTGSFTKSQQLLALAIDVSRGSGQSLETVVSDLTRAFIGQTRGLTKYNLGLTTAELKTANFSDLQTKLNKQFSGQNAAYLQTYAGQLSLINVGYANMTESIGEGLVDAFGMLAGDSGIQGATAAMEEFGTISADVIRGVGSLLGEVTQAFAGEGGLQQMLDFAARSGNPLAQALAGLQERGAANRPLMFPRLGVGEPGLLAQREKLEKEAEARAKRLAALQAKSERERVKREKEAQKRERETQMLKRAGTVFDMENIQIVAALQGRIDENQRLRLTALLAINTQNAEAAEKLSLAVLATNAAALESVGVIIKAGDNVTDVIFKLINAQAALSLVKLGVASIPKAKNPFEDWPDVMSNILNQIKKINAELNKVPALSAGGVTTTPGGAAQVAETASAAVAQAEGRASGMIFSPSGTPFVVPSNVGAAALDDPRMFVEAFSNVLSNPQLNWQAVGDTYETNVNVYGSVTSDADLVEMITNEIYKAQKSGKGILLNSVAI